MSNKPIEEMTAISVSDRIGLLRKALIDGVARAMAQEGNDGLPTFDDLVEKYFPELFVKPAVPGKGSQIKAGEIFSLSIDDFHDPELSTYRALRDFDLEVEYRKDLDNVANDDSNPLLNDLKPGKAYCAMGRRLLDEGVIEVLQHRVHHLHVRGVDNGEPLSLADFLKGQWRGPEDLLVPREDRHV